MRMSARVKPKLVVHSALRPPMLEIQPQDEVVFANSVAFVHDITRDPLPSVYQLCDVLYAELPWRAGLAEFDRRAGHQQSFAQFMAAVRGIVARFPRVVLLGGQHMCPLLPQPTQVLPVKLRGANALVLVYGLHLDGSFTQHWQLLAYLAQQYERIGDFCCGYGEAGYYTLRARKGCVLSDYNPQCIGYIAAHWREWLS